MSDAVSRRGLIAGLGAGLAALFGGGEALAVRGSRGPRNGMQVYMWEGPPTVRGEGGAMFAEHGLGTTNILEVRVAYGLDDWNSVTTGTVTIDENTLQYFGPLPRAVRVFAAR